MIDKRLRIALLRPNELPAIECSQFLTSKANREKVEYYMAKDLPLNSLGFAKPVSETRVVVAMSGGVDSSVVAALLYEQGYDVIGVTLQLYDHGAALAKKGACCAGIDIYDARKVADQMDFPHYVLDYENVFKEAVIDEFAQSYIAGATPVPCIRCNERVKFKDLLQTARDLDADCMATGHYIQRKIGPNGAELHCAADADKDQSYFLFSTTPAQLDFLRFPLGHLASKEATRKLAEKYNLSVADKPDSQDICFIPNGDYASVIEKLHPEAAAGGEIIHVDGRVLGRHEGVIRYTVGQRRGLGIGGLHEPIYVISLDVESKRVIVGPKELLKTRLVPVSEINWLGTSALSAGQELQISVKVRSTRPSREAILRPLSDTECVIELLNPEEGVAPGQACVFYETGGTRILGGGWITKRA